MQNLMGNWAQNDPTGAGKFIVDLPEGKSRDAAVQSYVSNLSWQSPELAAPMIALIGDDNQRYSSAQNLIHNYGRNDPEGARKWLTELNLPEDKKSRLLNQLPKVK